MGRGRPGRGPTQVRGLEADAETKRRLEVILETIADKTSLSEACERLEVSPSRLHAMRRRALEGALAGLAPGRAGRPRHEDPEETDRVAEFEAKIRDLEVDLEAARVRTELALVMPERVRRWMEKRGAAGAKAKGRKKGRDRRG